MTDRDRFALAAMPVLLKGALAHAGRGGLTPAVKRDVAEEAYEMADALIAASVGARPPVTQAKGPRCLTGGRHRFNGDQCVTCNITRREVSRQRAKVWRLRAVEQVA